MQQYHCTLELIIGFFKSPQMGEGNSFTLGGARVPERVAKIHGAPGGCWSQLCAGLSCTGGWGWQLGVT